jgi:superfamily II DNA or RNA helicase
MKAIVITHNDNIKEQWKSSMLKMTDLDEESICNIDGSATIKKLLKMKKLPYKVYLINHRSIQSYAKKEGWMAITELFEKLKVGVKVFDEAHLEFDNLMKTDLYTNVKKTIYLTATFQRSDYREDKVFSMCFKNIPMFGKETRDEKRKHIVYMAVKFNTRPDFQTQALIKGRHGFDRNRYIDYELQQPLFYKVIQYVLDYISDQEGKILILFSKNDAIDQVYDYLQKNLNSDRTIGKYNSTVSDEEKRNALGADIILSTPKSLGTGSDIPGLRFNIVTEQYSSPTSASQMSGRLREYAPDKFTFHFELIDEGFPVAVNMYKKRLPVFKKGKCVQLVELKYDDKKLKKD